jgi:hypothetical protein
MARYNGRVIVSKVDANGKKIKEKLSVWIAKHPGEMYFDSLLEQEVWEYLNDNKINHETKKEILLFDSCDTTEFKPSDKAKGTEARIVKSKQRPMKYTPDYYLPDYDTYIEVKGFAEEAFKMRWKLFKLAGHIGYLVYSLKEFVEVLKLLKESTKKQN